MAKTADTVLTKATAVALKAIQEVTRPELVGKHLRVQPEGERLATHYFECLSPGYVGWNWVVTLARAPRSSKATVCEVELLPGDSALLAPPWVPWVQRILPEDLGKGDVLPYRPQDKRLDQGYEGADEIDADRELFAEMGLGRTRILSYDGRTQAARRWDKGQRGPLRSAIREGNTCANCGFSLRLAGSLRLAFGVCANESSPNDGCVVSLGHYCGAHSETDAPTQGTPWPVTPTLLSEGDLEIIPAGSIAPAVTPAPVVDSASEIALEQ